MNNLKKFEIRTERSTNKKPHNEVFLYHCIYKKSKLTEEIIEKLKKFRDGRNWDQFHNNKDLAIALNIEI